MKHYRVALILVFVAAIANITACKFKPGCILEDRAAKGLANAISGQLGCKREDLVYRDVGLWLESKLKLCSTAARPVVDDPKLASGPIASIVCPIVAPIAANALPWDKIPASWECDSSGAKEKIKAILTTGCLALPF